MSPRNLDGAAMYVILSNAGFQVEELMSQSNETIKHVIQEHFLNALLGSESRQDLKFVI